MENRFYFNKNGDPVNVLIIDDNGILLRTAKEMLEEQFDVSIAPSCELALKAVKKKKPDIILLDYEMPIMNGIDTLKALREKKETREIPIIFLTGVADKSVVTEILSLKPDGYMLKPPNKQKLIDLIEKILFPEDKIGDDEF